MPVPDHPWPRRFDQAIQACAGGNLPTNVAVMQMAALAIDAAELRRVVDRAAECLDSDALALAGDLIRSEPGIWRLVREVLETASANDTPAGWASAFDRAVSVSPEASVALYSLGRPDLLQAATDEVISALRQRGLLGRDMVAVEVGCGIGRYLTPLAGELRLVVGIEISTGMLAEAARRSGGLAPVALVRGSGHGLAFIRDQACDLVLALDSFPYIFAAGRDVMEAHLADFARILRPGGGLVILNWSYRGDPAKDRAEASSFSVRHGLELVENGWSGLRHWDGRIFRYRKPMEVRR